MNTETLKITWKYIRWAGQGRTPVTYCSYIAENENHKHRLKTIEGSDLFELLHNTRIGRKPRYPKCAYSILIDILYNNEGKVISITNPKRCDYETQIPKFSHLN
jgi:hypothetical protein